MIQFNDTLEKLANLIHGRMETDGSNVSPELDSSAVKFLKILQRETGFTLEQIAATVLEMPGIVAAFKETIRRKDEDVEALSNLLKSKPSISGEDRAANEEIQRLKEENRELQLELDAADRRYRGLFTEHKKLKSGKVSQEFVVSLLERFQEVSETALTLKTDNEDLKSRLRRTQQDLHETIRLIGENEEPAALLEILGMFNERVAPLVPKITALVDKVEDRELSENLRDLAQLMQKAANTLYSLVDTKSYIDAEREVRDLFTDLLQNHHKHYCLPVGLGSKLDAIVITMGSFIEEVGFFGLPQNVIPCQDGTPDLPYYYEVLPLEFKWSPPHKNGASSEDHTFYIIYAPSIMRDRPIMVIGPDEHQSNAKILESILNPKGPVHFTLDDEPDPRKQCPGYGTLVMGEHSFTGCTYTLEEAVREIAHEMSDYFQALGFLTMEKIEAFERAQTLLDLQRQNPKIKILSPDLI